MIIYSLALNCSRCKRSRNVMVKKSGKIPKYHKILSKFNRQGSLEVVVFKTPGFDNFTYTVVA